MPAPRHESAGPPRDFTIEEVERLGRALTPHFRLVVREETAPIVDAVNSLKRKSSAWGAVTGALTAAAIAIFSRLTGNN